MFLKEIEFHGYLVDSYNSASTAEAAGNILVSLFHVVQNDRSPLKSLSAEQFDARIAQYFGNCEKFHQARAIMRTHLDLA